MLEVRYSIYNSWKALDDVADSDRFMCYKISTGQVVALDYEDMRRLFVTNNKAQILEANANLISGLNKALEAESYTGSIEV